MDVWILYKTTNLINSKIYVGVHKTNKRIDQYLGSGKALSLAIKKYGKNNFRRETLCVGNREFVHLMEYRYVDEEFIAREDTYNMQRGGSLGSWQPSNRKETEDEKYHRMRGIRGMKITKEIIYKRRASRKANNNPKWSHTVETKKFMSKMMKELPKDHPAKATQFKKGRTPYNKGKKMDHHSTGKQVLINGVTYPSAKNASEILGIRRGIIHAKLHDEEYLEFLYI